MATDPSHVQAKLGQITTLDDLILLLEEWNFSLKQVSPTRVNVWLESPTNPAKVILVHVKQDLPVERLTKLLKELDAIATPYLLLITSHFTRWIFVQVGFSTKKATLYRLLKFTHAEFSNLGIFPSLEEMQLFELFTGHLYRLSQIIRQIRSALTEEA